MRDMVNGILWYFTPDSLRKRKYREEIDHIKANTEINMMLLYMQHGVIREDYDQCHDMMADLVQYAHSKGIRIGLTLNLMKGWHNTGFDPNIPPEIGQYECYPIDHPENAQALAQQYELVTDEDGYAYLEHHAEGARPRLSPLYNKLLKIYAFDKTREGFYVPGSLEDVTAKAQILQCRTHMLTADIELGREYAGKTLFALVAQYYNHNELFGDSDWESRKAVMDMYSDIPLDGVSMDEYGYMWVNHFDVNSGKIPLYCAHFYSPAQKKFYWEKYGLDYDRELLDMRYVPEGDEAVRIRAVNRYIDELRAPILREENRVAEYAKKLFGEDVYIGVHNTFHNNLDQDEVHHSACAWWDLPRQFGHTDGELTFPARMGILLSAQDPLMVHTYYDSDPENIYQEMVYDAPFNIRYFHHAFEDFYYGCSYREPELLKNTRILDKQIARLNDFQSEPPKMNLLIIYGYAAQYNWYPDIEARNVWDNDGKMQIEKKCDAIWDAGYRAALIPDYTITDGRVGLDGNRFTFGGHTFDHCLFLYPKYAHKETYNFLNRAIAQGASLCVVGDAEVDFDAEPNHLNIETQADFSLELLEKMGCEKLAIPDGCVYRNGGFCIMQVSGLLYGEKTAFDFISEGVHYHGISTGLVAYRKGEKPITTPGSVLFADEIQIPLS